MRALTITLLLIGLMLPASVSATAVVLFRTPERVVLAADSRESIYNERGERYAFKETCKLRRAGRWFVAWGALEAVHERNLLATFVDELRSVERFADITPAVVAFGERELTAIDWSRHEPTYGPGAVLMWAGVGGLDDGEPVAGVYTAVRAADGGIDFDLLTCPGTCPAGGIAVGGAVADGPLPQALRQPDQLAPYDGAVALRLLEAQAKATRHEVAPPFSVIEITPQGARWIGRDPEVWSCPEEILQ